MSEIRLRISPAGTVRGLYDDAVDWRALGRVRVERASCVEFDADRQQWTVQIGRARSALRYWLQRLLGRPFGETVHRAATRREALDWERRHFGPGGPGWPERGTAHAPQPPGWYRNRENALSARLSAAVSIRGLSIPLGDSAPQARATRLLVPFQHPDRST